MKKKMLLLQNVVCYYRCRVFRRTEKASQPVVLAIEERVNGGESVVLRGAELAGEEAIQVA